MKSKLLLGLGIIALLCCFSCSEDSDSVPTETGSNVIEVTADIDAPTTWLDGKVYLIKKNDFYVNNTLTIEAGVVVKFHPDYDYIVLGGTGTIVANGTLDKHIVFTSYKDDAHGGDTNGDGTATSPASKDWSNINTNALNGSSFNYCEFLYGGNGTYTNTLEIYSSVASVTNCLFAHNDGSDGSMDFGALDCSAALAGTVVQNNIFYDNIRPLSISTAFSLDNSNVFHNPADANSTNAYNYIYVESINEIVSNISWSETEVPYIIDDNDLWIMSTYSLTLANDVVLKFTPSSEIVCANGASNIINYNGTGVYFTSFKDDSRGGDSNADVTATSPANGDWEGLYSDASSSYFSWTNILYDNH